MERVFGGGGTAATEAPGFSPKREINAVVMLPVRGKHLGVFLLPLRERPLGGFGAPLGSYKKASLPYLPVARFRSRD